MKKLSFGLCSFTKVEVCARVASAGCLQLRGGKSAAAPQSRANACGTCASVAAPAPRPGVIHQILYAFTLNLADCPISDQPDS